MKAKDSKIIGDNERMRRWKEYFQQTLNTNTVPALNAGIEEEMAVKSVGERWRKITLG